MAFLLWTPAGTSTSLTSRTNGTTARTPKLLQDVEKDMVCCPRNDHREQRWTGNHTDRQVRLIWSGIWHYSQTIGCRERRVDVAVLATSGCATAKSNSTSWVRLYHHRVVTYNSDIPRWKHYRECAVQCSICMSNCQSTVGVPGASIGDQNRACETRLYLFLYTCIVCVCCLPIYSGRQACGRTSRGHTEGRSHRISHSPSFCCACLNFSRKNIQPFLSLVDREVEFLCTKTN